jgi:hypothetical protein
MRTLKSAQRQANQHGLQRQHLPEVQVGLVEADRSARALAHLASRQHVVEMRVRDAGQPRQQVSIMAVKASEFIQQ